MRDVRRCSALEVVSLGVALVVGVAFAAGSALAQTYSDNLTTVSPSQGPRGTHVVLRGTGWNSGHLDPGGPLGAPIYYMATIYGGVPHYGESAEANTGSSRSCDAGWHGSGDPCSFIVTALSPPTRR
jgi:hypothetical protein